MLIINKLKKVITVLSREKKLEQFYALFKNEMTVLDVGFSNETKRKVPDTTNYFIKTYRYNPGTYTGLSNEQTDGMEQLYPGFKFVSYSGGRFPFNDNEFDWVFSNAVIEHVGADDNQKVFLNEMLRVSRNVFFTTPNKFLPVESHSNILFLHWNDSVFCKYCKKRKQWWSTKDHLYLFSKNRLKKLLKESDSSEYQIYCNRTALMTMTFTVVCRK